MRNRRSADLGTRKGAKVRDVGPESDWICGYNWMRMSEHDFPLKTAAELILPSYRTPERSALLIWMKGVGCFLRRGKVIHVTTT